MSNYETLKTQLQSYIFSTFKNVPTEAEFKSTVLSIAEKFQKLPMFKVTAKELKQIIAELEENFQVKMDVGVYLCDDDEYQSWLPKTRAQINFYFWNRYRKYLEIDLGWGKNIVAKLDIVTDEILDLLGNPKASEPFQKRGLILGDVQSGKTANYTAICNKAFDAGYRIVVVLAGMLENLRVQTQDRLDTELCGRESAYYLQNQTSKNRWKGVGLRSHEHSVCSFTSISNDFSSNVLKTNNLSLSMLKEPVLLVVKKNKSVLTNLYNWLVSNNQSRDGKIDLPVLVIDDEADNASVNTKAEDSNPSAINEAIRNLLKVFTRASYVGVTATPFANIFINDDPELQDLFPKDFIYALEAPSNYIGADKIFKSEDEGGKYNKPELFTSKYSQPKS